MYKSKDFVELRSWILDNSVTISIEEIRNLFEEMISAADISAHVSDIVIDGNQSAIAIHSNASYKYMGVYVYCQGNTIGMALEGKGEQIKATDLVKLYYKATGALSGAYGGYRKSKDIMRRFGMGGAASSFGAGVGVAAGSAITGSVKLIAKGVKALLRDQEAYDKEMAFYELALGLGDYLVGGSDTGNIISRLMTSAEKGDEIAQYLIGNAYAEGRGIDSNLDEAVKWFALAASQNENRSKEILAVEYLYGEKEYSIEEKNTGLKYLKEMADAGDEDAAINIIDIYGFKAVKGIPVDLSKMIEVAEVYADRGNIYAVIVLARTYDTSMINEAVNDEGYKDDKEAARWYERILILGDSEYREEAAMRLADMYMEGRGVEKDQERAVKNLRVAAQCGNTEAKVALAYNLTLGIGATKDHTTAQKLCREVIQKGDQLEKSIAYYCSYKIFDEEKKYKQSMEYARKCLESGNIDEHKKAELQEYLAKKEELIGNMTEEEKREYLQERKPLFSFKSKTEARRKRTNYKRWIIVGGIVLILIFIVVIAIMINVNKSNSYNDSSSDHRVQLNDNSIWGKYDSINHLGDSYENVESEYGNKLVYIGDAEFGSIWQHDTIIGAYYQDGLYKLNNSELTFSFGYFDEGYLCDKQAGTAEEMLGIKSPINIRDLMNSICLSEEGINEYSLSNSSDIYYWFGLKNDQVIYDAPHSTSGYVYIIFVYSEGLKKTRPIIYPFEENELINADNIGQYYEGYAEDYDMVYPETKVEINIIPYGVGF